MEGGAGAAGPHLTPHLSPVPLSPASGFSSSACSKEGGPAEIRGPFLSDTVESLVLSFEALISTGCSFRSWNLCFSRSRAYQGQRELWVGSAGLCFSIIPRQNGEALICQPDTNLQLSLILSDRSCSQHFLLLPSLHPSFHSSLFPTFLPSFLPSYPPYVFGMHFLHPHCLLLKLSPLPDAFPFFLPLFFLLDLNVFSLISASPVSNLGSFSVCVSQKILS